MTASAAPRKHRAPKTPIARGIKLPADVTVRTFLRDGFRDTEVDIGPDRLARLALAGRIPAEQLDALRDHSRFLVMEVCSIVEEMSVQRTRSQLRHELLDLLRELKSGRGLAVVPPWLRSEIEGCFLRCRLDLPFGKFSTISAKDADALWRRQAAARAEILAAFSDAAKLADIIEDVLSFLKRSKPYTREFFASKSAFRPELEIIFGWIDGFWHGVLRRDLIRSDELRDFSIEAIKMCGAQLSGLSLERRLQAMIRSAARAD